MSETYVSLDIESTGPVPGLYSMIALGAAAFSQSGQELGCWTANLQELEGAGRHPDTMAWWQTRPREWEQATRDQEDPATAMAAFSKWVQKLPGKKIAAAWPAAFDFAFVNYYCHRFTGGNPLGFACLDIRSLAMGVTRSQGYYDLKQTEIQQMWQVAKQGLNAHVALDDAIEQGRLLVQLLRWQG